MKLVDGKVIATSEDYLLHPNELHVHEIGDYVAFRILTENGQFFAACIDKDAPPHDQLAVALWVKHRAEQAPHLAPVRDRPAPKVNGYIVENEKESAPPRIVVDTKTRSFIEDTGHKVLKP